MLMWFLKYRMPTYTVFINSYIVAFAFILVALNISRYYRLGEGTMCYRVLKREGMGIYLWHVIIVYLAYYYNAFSWVRSIFSSCIHNAVFSFAIYSVNYLYKKIPSCLYVR